MKDLDKYRVYDTTISASHTQWKAEGFDDIDEARDYIDHLTFNMLGNSPIGTIEEQAGKIVVNMSMMNWI